jgi:phage gpG-like protein
VDFDVQIEGIAELRARVDGIIERTRNLSPGLLRAGVIALDGAKEHIEEGGPGWPANISGTPLLRKTGRLFNSLTAQSGGDTILRVDADVVEAGTNVNYARLLQGGTGIYGERGQRIRPNHEAVGNAAETGIFHEGRSPALSFTLGGKRVFYSSIKGTPKRRFLYIDEKIAASVRASFAEYIMGANGVQHE